MNIIWEFKTLKYQYWTYKHIFLRKKKPLFRDKTLGPVNVKQLWNLEISL